MAYARDNLVQEYSDYKNDMFDLKTFRKIVRMRIAKDYKLSIVNYQLFRIFVNNIR